MKNEEKLCPFAFSSGQYKEKKCKGSLCSFWCEFANRCSIPLLTEMFADSTVCQNVFNKVKITEENLAVRDFYLKKNR